MFEIKLDGMDALAAKFEKLEKQIGELHTTWPDELTAWQREDMKRKYPNTQAETANNETKATTYVWPRSRTPNNSRRFQAPKQHLPVKRGPVVRSNRPILRAELLTRLYDRMKKLASEALKWP